MSRKTLRNTGIFYNHLPIRYVPLPEHVIALLRTLCHSQDHYAPPTEEEDKLALLNIWHTLLLAASDAGIPDMADTAASHVRLLSAWFHKNGFECYYHRGEKRWGLTLTKICLNGDRITKYFL